MLSELLDKYIDIELNHNATNYEVNFAKSNDSRFSTTRPYRVFKNKYNGTEIVIGNDASVVPVIWLVTLDVDFEVRTVEE